MRIIRIIDKGVMEYGEAWEFQKEIFERMLDGSAGEDCLIYCEHPHVYTLGKSGRQNNLLIDEAFLEKIGAAFFTTDRGGDITYHGYGQLVGYPILNISRFGLSLKAYIRAVEEAVIRTIAEYGVQGYCSEGATGVWVKDARGAEAKICAVGVKASRHITMHGFALNVNTDLGYFDHIHPCGFTDKGVTSLEKLTGAKVDIKNVKRRFADHFTTLIHAQAMI